MPAISLIAVRTLDKNGTVAEALGKHLPSDIIQSHATTCRMYHRKIHVKLKKKRQKKTEKKKSQRLTLEQSLNLSEISVDVVLWKVLNQSHLFSNMSLSDTFLKAIIERTAVFLKRNKKLYFS